MRELVVCHFKHEDIFAAWAKLREACQLAAGQPVQVPTKHRSEAKLAEELVKEVFDSDKNGVVSLLIPPAELGLVRMRMESTLGDERPVAARLESLEDMVGGVVEKLARMETNQDKMAKVVQPVVQEPAVQQPVAVAAHQHVQGGGQPQSYAGAAASGLSFVPNPLQHLLAPPGGRYRRNSVKRSISGVPRDSSGNIDDKSEEVFTEVTNKKRKKKEVSTGTATLQSIPGVNIPLQASYQHFVGNTPGTMGEDTLKVVFKELAVQIMEEKGLEGSLEIEECNLLTREQNTRTRVWRIVVPYKYKEVMQDDRLYPTGWHHREFEGHYRPPLSAQERAEKDAKRTARQQNDARLSVLLRHLAGPTQ